MKRIIAAAIVSFGLAFIQFALPSAYAQGGTNAHLVRIQGAGQPVPVARTCNVNGLVYPVDFAGNIWGINLVTGIWFIVGHLYLTTNGPVAIDSKRISISSCLLLGSESPPEKCRKRHVSPALCSS